MLDDLRKLRAERAKQNQPSDNQRNEGAKEITAALTALRDWLSYIIASTGQGRFGIRRESRAEISRGLRAATASPRDWEAILTGAESVGYKLEEEGDRARRDEADDFNGAAVNDVRIASLVNSFSSRFAGLDFSLRHRLFWFFRFR